MFSSTFGRGWELEHFTMQAHTPNYWQIIAYPKAWSPSTDGEVTGEVIYLQADDEAGLEKYKGKLKGEFVLLDTIRTTKEWFDPPANRRTNDELLDMANAPMPTPRPRRNFNRLGGLSFNQKMWNFLAAEQPLAVLDRSYKGDLGTVFVSRARTGEGRPWNKGITVVPQATLAVEHYNRIFRLTQKDIPVKLSLEIKSILPPLGLPLLPSRWKIAACFSFKLPLTAITLTIPGWGNSLLKFMQISATCSLTLAPLFTCLPYVC